MEVSMKSNLIRQRLAEGKIPVGHMIMEFGTRGIAKTLEASGVDFALLDMEHSGLGFTNICDLLAWFKSTPVTPIVRVPCADYHFIARVMDAGAQGVMVPNVKSSEQARQVIAALRFMPDGNRGLGLGGAQNDYVRPEPMEYMSAANESNIFLCQIESTEALNELDAIASLPGVDNLWVGHYDLSQSMGIVGQLENPVFVDTLQRVADAAKRHGKSAGIQPSTLEQARDWIGVGFNVISYNVDYGVYSTALKTHTEAIRKL
ncbi:MAG: hypothetical protein CMN58_02215 [Solibacterales bacterium]|nr:hypothetical protein [Bryobacterales bacterium]